MREKFPDLSRDLYLRPDVHIHVEDGRSFVRRSTEKFQVLQATLVDTWASTAAGAFALSENNLYTADAFRDYLRTSPTTALIAFTRWGFDPPRESLRLISLAIEALNQIGEDEPATHVIVGRQRHRGRLGRAGYRADLAQAVQRRPISSARKRHVHGRRHAGRLSARRSISTIISTICCMSPESGGVRAQLHLRYHAGHRQPAVLLLHRAAARPVEFHQERLARNRRLQDQQSRAAAVRPDGGSAWWPPLLILLLPPLVLGTRLPRHRGVLGFLLYFLFIGTGYILIEVGADPEIRALPGPSDLRADRGDLLHAGLERHGQFRQPPPAGQ